MIFVPNMEKKFIVLHLIPFIEISTVNLLLKSKLCSENVQPLE